MVFEVKFSESAEKQRARTKSHTAERLGKERMELAERTEKKEKVTLLESEPGQLESAIGSGDMDLKKEYMTSDGKIDDVKLEEMSQELLNSTINLEVLPADVAKDVTRALEEMSKDPEFAVQKLQFEDAIKVLRAIEAPRLQAEEEAKTDIKEIDVDSTPMPIEVTKTLSRSLEIEDVLARAVDLGYPQLEGVLAMDIEDAKDDIKNIKDKLAKEHKMSASDISKAENGTLKVGFFGRFGGLLLGRIAHKNAMIAKLGEKSTMLKDYARLEADANAKGVDAVRQERKTLPSLAKRYSEHSQPSGIKGITR